MSTEPRFAVGILAALHLALLGGIRPAVLAQQPAWQDPNQAIAVELPAEVGLSVASRNFGETEIYARGGAIVIDLRCDLVLRNEGSRNIRGVVFAVLAQQMTAGGKASVAVPSLNVSPGETFPVSLNLRLLRPLPGPPNPLVTVTADGVLFADLSFRGQDTLHSRRKMLAWEMESRRDRDYFKALLASGGEDTLKQEMLGSLARQRHRPRLDARQAGDSGRTVASAVSASAEREVELALLDFPDAPLELVSGRAHVSGATVSSPTIRVRNRSGKAVRYFELGWLVRDAAGTSYAAGSVPAPVSELHIEPGETLATGREQYFLFTRRSGASESPFSIEGMSGYVKQVQFDDGTLWIPARQQLIRSALADTIPVSPEEQRLSDLYRLKGLNALIEELNKF